MSQLPRNVYLGATTIAHGGGSTGASSSTGSLSAETMIVGTLLTITRIQSIGELIAANVDIQKTYFTANNLSQSDYENFLQVNGVIITFSDSLENKYVIPSTYVNWPPSPNGYPYQVMGANIALGPFMADEDLTSEVAYISCVIEKITGIVPQVTLTELSNVYIVDKHKSTQIENIRNNNINGIGTPNYYQNQIDQIENAISTLGTLVYANSASLGLSVYDPCGSQSQTTTPPITPQITGFALFGGGRSSSYTNVATSLTAIYDYTSNSSMAGANLSQTFEYCQGAGNSTIGVFGGGSIYGSNTSIYTYASNTAVAGTDLVKNLSSQSFIGSSMSTGNSTTGIFALSALYEFASNISIVSSAIFWYSANAQTSTNITAPGATSTSTNAYFCGTVPGPPFSTIAGSVIYNYATNTVANATAMNQNLSQPGAAGNSTMGVFGGGVTEGPSSVTSIYLYASNVTNYGGILTYTNHAVSAAGNSTIGVFGGGTNNSETGTGSLTSVYLYANNTVTEGGNLMDFFRNPGACSSSNIGVIS